MGNGGRFATRRNRSQLGLAEPNAGSRTAASLHSSPHHSRLLPAGGGGGGSGAGGAPIATSSTMNQSHGHLLSSSSSQFADVARESPTKITHGFWMQQYNWLHSRQDGDELAASGELRESHQQQQQQQHPPTRRQKIWHNLKRTFGGSASDVTHAQKQQQQPAQANRWQQSPAGSGRARFAAHAAAPSGEPATRLVDNLALRLQDAATTSGRTGSGNVACKKKRKNWFSRQVVSSSASNLPTAPTTYNAGQQNEQLQQQQRSQSSCLREKMSSSNEQQQRELSSQKSPTKSSSSSPYRQIARVISRAGKCRQASKETGGSRSPKVEQRKWQGKRRRSPTQRELDYEQNAPSTAATGNEASGQFAPNEPAAGSSNSGVGGGILSSFFASSPLFRRPKKRFASPVAVKGAAAAQSDQIKSKQQPEQQHERQQTQGQRSVGVVVGASCGREAEIRGIDVSVVGQKGEQEQSAAAMNAKREFKFQTPATRRVGGGNDDDENYANERPEEVTKASGRRFDFGGAGAGGSGSAARQPLGQLPTQRQTSPSDAAIKSKLERTFDGGTAATTTTTIKTSARVEMMQEPGGGVGDRRQDGQVYQDYEHQDQQAAPNQQRQPEVATSTGGRDGSCDKPQGFGFGAATCATSSASREERRTELRQDFHLRDADFHFGSLSPPPLAPSSSDRNKDGDSSDGQSATSSELAGRQKHQIRIRAQAEGPSGRNERSPEAKSKKRQGGQQQQQQQRSDLKHLIQPTPVSSSSSSSSTSIPSSFASSSICFESAANANLLPAQLRHSRVSIAIDGVEEVELCVGGVSSSDDPNAVEVDSTTRPASQPAQARGSQLVSSSGGDASDGAEASSSGRAAQRPASQTAGAAVALRDNFKKLVKRQQSVDSYRMARELKRKQKQQNETRTKHQSNEAIKQTNDPAVGGSGAMISHSQSGQHQGVGSTSSPSQTRKFSMRTANFSAGHSITRAKPTKIRIDSTGSGQGQVARAKFAMNVNDADDESEDASRRNDDEAATGEQQPPATRPPPTPPNTLSLMPSAHLATGSTPSASGTSHHNTLSGGGGGGAASPYMLATFSGCITPTYLTHHLPSPKYVSPALANAKKYSNASTISSTMGDIGLMGSGRHHNGGGTSAGADTTTATTNLSDTESSIGGGGGSATPSRSVRGVPIASPSGGSLMQQTTLGQLAMDGVTGVANLLVSDPEAEAREAAAAAKRANLAEHIYDNKCGLGEDMKFLASLPELCDITFLVGETREPVCAVKSVLAARSRVFHKILFGGQREMRQRIARQQRQQEDDATLDAPMGGSDRRGSSPKQPGGGGSLAKKMSLVAKGSSPLSRSTSPQQQQQQQQSQQPGWSVVSDASGYNAPSPYPDSSGGPESTSRSGRVSVVSNGRESLGQASMGSQQPLIIGPGQTAAPASSKRNKKSSIREAAAMAMASASGRVADGHAPREKSRLSRMFMKRASDPSIKQQQHQQSLQLKGDHHHGGSRDQASQSYLDKMSSSQMSTTMIIEEFEPDVFRQLIEYIHTGCVLLQARTLLGLLNAADYYGLEQLRKACLRFVSCCITVDTVCSLLSTAERYIQYKCTKSIVQKVLEFVDTHANEIFKLNAFGLLPEHVVRLILARDGLKADEHVKYNGVYTWCEHYCRSYELTNIADVMCNFLDLIQFHKIPTNVLLSEIYPTHIVPDNIFLSALACQADPQNFEPQPSRQRRMTLPNPMIYKDSYSDEDNDHDAEHSREQHSQQHHHHQQQQSQDASARAKSRSSVQVDSSTTPSRRQSIKDKRRRSKAGSARGGDDNSPSIGGSREQLVGLARSSSKRNKSTSGGDREDKRPADSRKGSSAGTSSVGGVKLRKGSIAQVSISGMVRLSHKLSIRKKSHHHPSNKQQDAHGDDPYADIKSSRRQSVGKQQSLISSGRRSGGGATYRQSSAQQPSDDGDTRADPLAVGQQILNAYLVAQRQRELEEEERRRQEQLERQAAAKEAKRNSGTGSGTASMDTPSSSSHPMGVPGQQSTDLSSQRQRMPKIQRQASQQQQQHQQTRGESRRRSFRDFKSISRRLFMRASSSKLLQQTSSVSSTGNQDAAMAAAATTSGGHPTANRQSSDSVNQQPATPSKRRNMLKIKRSETVYESSSSHQQPASTQKVAGSSQALNRPHH